MALPRGAGTGGRAGEGVGAGAGAGIGVEGFEVIVISFGAESSGTWPLHSLPTATTSAARARPRAVALTSRAARTLANRLTLRLMDLSSNGPLRDDVRQSYRLIIGRGSAWDQSIRATDLYSPNPKGH
jgi:hypothetical protein